MIAVQTPSSRLATKLTILLFLGTTFWLSIDLYPFFNSPTSTPFPEQTNFRKNQIVVKKTDGNYRVIETSDIDLLHQNNHNQSIYNPHETIRKNNNEETGITTQGKNESNGAVTSAAERYNAGTNFIAPITQTDTATHYLLESDKENDTLKEGRKQHANKKAIELPAISTSTRKRDGENNLNILLSPTRNAGKTKENESILSLLQEADPQMLIDEDTLSQLPTLKDVVDLYYAGENMTKPIMYGMNTCATYRELVAPENRILAVAGLFNTGTNALAWTLAQNIKLPRRSGGNAFPSSTRWQVPWGKHWPVRDKWNHTASDGLGETNKAAILPIVIIKDPFYWLQSMCKNPYGAFWMHRETHCPNLVPNEFDKERFAQQLRVSNGSNPVHVGADRDSGLEWPSLIHLWNDWYRQYLEQVPDHAPRLMVRFEDLLFAPRQLLQQIALCVLGEDVSYAKGHNAALFDESIPIKVNARSSKQHGSQTDLISALIKYGKGQGRVSNMTKEDLRFSQQTLDPELMSLFRYQLHSPL